ncbi:Hypothetical protein NTJ_10539 [Nesidiocoris tenuis]|uniref:Uncharacterized protein n=1 Tax=Nesidiocoris tenuis TaxID=355587 RepID=A0ABN7B3G8_9HEMI|nr:Hypothetical protein NTJ_10539 [Nesidiocoris tenuis]
MEEKTEIRYFVDESRGKSVDDHFKNAEPFVPLRMSRKIYRKFLEESGIVSELTKILFQVYDMKEKPPYFVHFFKKYFGGTDHDIPNIYRLRQELATSQGRLSELQKENQELKKKLCSYENYWEMKPLDNRY